MSKICIFDLDGTLASTQESIARPVNMTLALYGLPAQPVEAFNYFAGDGLKNALKRALIAAGDTSASHLEEGLPKCRAWMQEDPAYHATPYEHMVWALRELKRHGVKIAVFSNKPHASAIGVVETIFGKDCFDHIQGQTDLIPIKPDPTGVFEILEKFGIEKSECLYFGDTNTDMLTARNAGVTAVGVTWGFRPRSELEEYGADILIDSAAEIPGLAGIVRYPEQGI
jgi:phosphoglycolate phosphatase